MSYIQIGPEIDGKQAVVIMKNSRVPMTYVTTPEQVDEFVSEANKADRKAMKKQVVTMFSAPILGAAIGILSKLEPYSWKKSALLGGLTGLVMSLPPIMHWNKTAYDKAIDKFIASHQEDLI